MPDGSNEENLMKGVVTEMRAVLRKLTQVPESLRLVTSGSCLLPVRPTKAVGRQCG